MRQHIRVPVHARVTEGGTFTLQAFVYRPAGGGPHPLAVLSHGSSGGDPKLEVPQSELAWFFTDRGFVVVVPCGATAARPTARPWEARTRTAPRPPGSRESTLPTMIQRQQLMRLRNCRRWMRAGLCSSVSPGGLSVSGLCRAEWATGPRCSRRRHAHYLRAGARRGSLGDHELLALPLPLVGLDAAPVRAVVRLCS